MPLHGWLPFRLVLQFWRLISALWHEKQDSAGNQMLSAQTGITSMREVRTMIHQVSATFSLFLVWHACVKAQCIIRYTSLDIDVAFWLYFWQEHNRSQNSFSSRIQYLVCSCILYKFTRSSGSTHQSETEDSQIEVSPSQAKASGKYTSKVLFSGLTCSLTSPSGPTFALLKFGAKSNLGMYRQAG